MLFSTSENCYFHPCVYLHLVWSLLHNYDSVVVFSFFFSPVFCDRGFKFSAENTACDACEVGMYKQQRGNNDTCEACPTNTTTADVASVSKNDCKTGKETKVLVYSISHQHHWCSIYFWEMHKCRCVECPTNSTTAVVAFSFSTHRYRCVACPTAGAAFI